MKESELLSVFLEFVCEIENKKVDKYQHIKINNFYYELITKTEELYSVLQFYKHITEYNEKYNFTRYNYLEICKEKIQNFHTFFKSKEDILKENSLLKLQDNLDFYYNDPEFCNSTFLSNLKLIYKPYIILNKSVILEKSTYKKKVKSIFQKHLMRKNQI